VIPVLDEEGSIGDVVRDLSQPGVRRVVVVDNGSADRSGERARAAGARVVVEPRRGYGAACLAGIAALEPDPPDVVVFADGDGSDDPADLAALTGPIAAGRADFVLGSRTGSADAVPAHAALGNRFACALMRVGLGIAYTDLGPYRAIRFAALRRLGMTDRGYGWTVEMQIRAARAGLRILELPVRARPRAAGRSKVSGTVRGTIGASAKILWTLAKHLPPAFLTGPDGSGSIHA